MTRPRGARRPWRDAPGGDGGVSDSGGGGLDAAGDAEVDAGTDAGPDGGEGTCGELPCRLVVPQCGCASAEGCYTDADGARGCRAAGDLALGEACVDDFACAPGLLCAGSPSLAACHRYCDSDADCPGESLCIIELPPPTGGTEPAARLCTPLCAPEEDTGCRSGAGCTIQREAEGALRHFTCCRPSGTGTQGTFCGNEEDCTGGHACIGGQCALWCRVGFPDCPASTTCQPFGSPIRIGATEYGVCQ